MVAFLADRDIWFTNKHLIPIVIDANLDSGDLKSGVETFSFSLSDPIPHPH